MKHEKLDTEINGYLKRLKNLKTKQLDQEFVNNIKDRLCQLPAAAGEIQKEMDEKYIWKVHMESGGIVIYLYVVMTSCWVNHLE